MVLLDHKELSKFRNGEYRWQLFLRKIKNGDWFKHKNGIEIKIMPEDFEKFKSLINSGAKTGVFDRELGRWKFRVITCAESLSSRKTVRLRELLKTAEFGAAGTSASEITKWVEYSVAKQLALKLGGKLSSCPYGKRPKPLVRAYIYKNFKVDDTVNSLLESEFLTNFQGATVHFRDHQFVDKVQAAYKDLAEGDEFWSIAKFDKWNPADIWITKGSVDIKSCTSLEELANLLYSDKCIGISLKKEGTNPTLVEGFQEGETIVAGSVRVAGNYNPEGSVTTLKVEGTQEDKSYISIGIRPINGGNFRLEVLGDTYRKGGCGRELLNRAGSVTKFDVEGLTIKQIQDKIYNATFDPKQAEKLAAFLTEVSKYAQSKASGHCPFIVT